MAWQTGPDRDPPRGIRYDRPKGAERAHLRWRSKCAGHRAAPRNRPAQGRQAQGREARDEADSRWSARGETPSTARQGRRSAEARTAPAEAAGQGRRASRRAGGTACRSRWRSSSGGLERRPLIDACTNASGNLRGEARSKAGDYARNEGASGETGADGLRHHASRCEFAKVGRCREAVDVEQDSWHLPNGRHQLDRLTAPPEVTSTEC